MISTRRLLLTGAVALLVVGAVAAFVAVHAPARDSATSATQFPNVRRLFGSNLVYYGEPTLSPDGRSIAYTSDKSGGLEIYVSGIVQGSREIATTGDGGQNEQPQWSPDGQWIAYHSQVHGGVWIVPATGGVARQVVDFGSQPSWSPDSRWLAFASYEGAIAAQSDIWIIRNDGTDRRQVTRLGSPPGGHHMPSWSRDGRHLAFGRYDGERTSDLWVVGIEYGMLKKLAESSLIPGGSVFRRSQFAYDDKALYFAGVTIDGNGRIFKMTLDRNTFEPSDPPQPVLAYGDAFPGDFSVTRDGTIVYGSGRLESLGCLRVAAIRCSNPKSP